MEEKGLRSNVRGLDTHGISKAKTVYWNQSPAQLIEHALLNNEGHLADNGSLCCDTGEFTGRSPKDRFVVEDSKTKDTVWWGDINIPISEVKFDQILNKMVKNLEGKNLYVRDAYAGADKTYRLNLRVINTRAWHNLFCHNMFIRPSLYKLEKFDPNFTIICDPDFKADPVEDGTRQGNFAIINFARRMILIGGTAYAGEMKKGIFSVL